MLHVFPQQNPISNPNKTIYSRPKLFAISTHINDFFSNKPENNIFDNLNIAYASMESCTGHNRYLCFVEAIVRSSSRVSLRRGGFLFVEPVSLCRAGPVLTLLSRRLNFYQSKKSIHFLDVTISINNDNTLSTDLYIKPTDTHQYLLSTSAHPKHTKQSIPYSLALRLRRICSEDETFKYRTRQLLEYLTQRGYKPKQTNKQIQKAAKKTRQDCLKTTKPRTNHRTPFVVTYHPALPQLSTILKQNLDILQNSNTCKEAFPDAPILSYRRPKNLRDLLVRAKIKNATPSDPRGSYKCHSRRNCLTCQHITDGTTTFNFSNTDKNYDIKQLLDCNSTNVIYALQ